MLPGIHTVVFFLLLLCLFVFFSVIIPLFSVMLL